MVRVVADGLKRRRLRTRRWAVVLALLASRSPSLHPEQWQGGMVKPNLVSSALAKILVCMEQKGI